MYIKFTQNVNFEGVNYTSDSESKSVTAETGASLIAAGLAVEVSEERTNVTYSATEGLMWPGGAISVGGGIDIASYAGADFGAKFNAAIAANGKEGVSFYATGEHTLTTAVDLTDGWNCKVDLRGARIKISGDIVGFDLTDTHTIEFYYSSIEGLQASPPKCAFLHGDTAADIGFDDYYGQARNERGCIRGGAITGYWSLAPVIHHGREMHKFSGNYDNYNSQGYCFAITRDAQIRIAGSLVTVASPYKGSLAAGGSPTKTWIHQASFFSVTNKGDGIVFLRGACGDTTIDTFEVRSLGEPIFVVDDNIIGPFYFTNFNTRIGTEAASPYSCDFMTFAQSTSQLAGLRVSGKIRLLRDSGVGTPGYVINMTGTSAASSDFVIDNLESVTFSNGYLFNSRGVTDFKLGKDVLKDSATWTGDNEIAGTNARQFFTSSARLKGTRGKTVTVSSNVGFQVAEGINYTSLENFDITNTSNSGVLDLANYGKRKDLRCVAITGGDGYSIRGKFNEYVNCSVTSIVTGGKFAVDFLPTSAVQTASYNTIVGGSFIGNIRFHTDGGSNHATGNKIIGAYIQGDVTFAAGTDNNKLIGCTVTGTVTNSGGVGNTVT